MDVVENRGSGQFNAAQFEVLRRYRGGLALNAAYTLAHSDSNAPDVGNSTIGPVMFDPYDIEKDRGPDPNVVKHRLVANATWDVPLGHGRAHGANMKGWTDALFGGWTVSTLFQARSGQHLTPFFYRLLHDEPVEHGQGTRWPGQLLLRELAAGSDPRSEYRRIPRCILRSNGVCPPATGQAWKRQKRKLNGPGNLGRELRVLQGRVRRTENFRLQFSALLDNAFNHPQFFPTVRERIRRSDLVLGGRGCAQRHYRCARRGLDRQH